jgi:hypothetical protein
MEKPGNFKKPKLEKVHHTQDIQKISDPVETFRNEFDTMIPDYEIGGSFEDVGYEPTEEEEYIFKNDPELQISKSEIFENIADNQDIHMSISDGYVFDQISSDVPKKLRRELEQNIEHEFRRDEYLDKLIDLDTSETSLDLENRDILSEILDQARKEKDELVEKAKEEKIEKRIIERRDLLRTKDVESAPMYGKDEFTLMKNIAEVYKARQAVSGLGIVSHPMFPSKQLLDAKQIMEQFEKYQKKDEVEPGTYSEAQLKNMEHSYNYVNFIKSQEPIIGFYKNEEGKFVQGELPEAEMNELAQQYFDLERDNFLEFAKCQKEAGFWKLKDFDWKQEKYEGMDQWYAKEHDKDATSGKKIVRKYISFDQPIPVERNTKLYAYTIKQIKRSIKDPEKDFEAIAIDIQKPSVIKESKPATVPVV